MDLSEEKLIELEKLAGAFMNIEKCAIILEVDQDELRTELKNKTSKAYLSYMKGKLENEFRIRKSIVELAQRGSSQAQSESMKLLIELNVDEA